MITVNEIQLMTGYEEICEAFAIVNSYDEHTAYVLVEALEAQMNLKYPLINEYAESVTYNNSGCQVTIKGNK